jgi:hypothetical protein
MLQVPKQLESGRIMDTSQPITAAGDPKSSLLEKIVNRVLRCSHRHQTSPITLKGETFAVCLDCGNRVPYSLQALRPETSTPANRASPAESKAPKVPEQDLPQTAPTAPAPGRNRVPISLPTPPQETRTQANRVSRPDSKSPKVPAHAVPRPAPATSVPKVRKKDVDAARPVARPRTSIREGVWIGLLAISVSGGVYYSASRTPASRNRTAPKSLERPVRPTPTASAIPPNATPAAVPQAPPISNRGTVPSAAPSPQTPAGARGSNQPVRLEGEDRYVVLARDASAALLLSQHPRRLDTLIQSGSLFAVPRGTAIQVLHRDRTIVHVQIKQGPQAGEDGWVLTSKLAP